MGRSLVLVGAVFLCAPSVARAQFETNGLMRMYVGTVVGFGMGAIGGFIWQGDPNKEGYDGDKVESAVLAGTLVGLGAGIVWAASQPWITSDPNSPPRTGATIPLTMFCGAGMAAVPAFAITLAADEDAETVLAATTLSGLGGLALGLAVGIHHVASRRPPQPQAALLYADLDGRAAIGIPAPVFRRLPDRTVSVGARLLALSF